MKTWTVDEMMAEHPCAGYTRERVTALWAGRERLSMLEICDLEIPPEDVVWVATTATALTQSESERWLTMIVTRAVNDHALNCGLPAVETWAARWLSGEDRSAASATSAASAAWYATSAASAAWYAASAASAALPASARRGSSAKSPGSRSSAR